MVVVKPAANFNAVGLRDIGGHGGDLIIEVVEKQENDIFFKKMMKDYWVLMMIWQKLSLIYEFNKL